MTVCVLCMLCFVCTGLQFTSSQNHRPDCCGFMKSFAISLRHVFTTIELCHPRIQLLIQ